MNNLFLAGLNFRLVKILGNVDKSVEPYFYYRKSDLYDVFDRATLDGLAEKGFKTNRGWKDTGLMLTVYNKAGGYYIGKTLSFRY